MKILFPTDGSEHSIAALRHLLPRLPWFRETPQLALLNVHPHLPYARAVAWAGKEAAQRYYDDECTAALAPGSAVLDAAGVPFERVERIGDPAVEIGKFAAEWNADLIAMGRHGHSAVTSLLMGSVTQKVHRDGEPAGPAAQIAHAAANPPAHFAIRVPTVPDAVGPRRARSRSTTRASRARAARRPGHESRGTVACIAHHLRSDGIQCGAALFRALSCVTPPAACGQPRRVECRMKAMPRGDPRAGRGMQQRERRRSRPAWGFRHEHRFREGRRLRRPGRRGRALPEARGGSGRGQQDVARLPVDAGRRRRDAGRQCEGPHRQRPVAERQGRGRGQGRRGPARPVEQPHQGDCAHREGRRRQGSRRQPNQHDVLTGTQPDGTAFPPGDDKTCGNWTSSTTGAAEVGHHDRQGLPTSPPA